MSVRNLPPAEWPRVRLSEVAEQCLGKMLDANRNKGQPLPYLRNPNVRWFDVDTSDLRTMPFEDHEHERYGLKAGDVVVCEGGEAGRAAIRYSFEHLPVEFIVGIVHPDNGASQRALSKLGLTRGERTRYFNMDCYRYVIDRAGFEREYR